MGVVHGQADDWLDLEQLGRLVAAPPQWVIEHVQAGLVAVTMSVPSAPGPSGWRFDSLVVARLRSMRRIEEGFDATPELAALVADLEEEVARLRSRLFVVGR